MKVTMLNKKFIFITAVMVSLTAINFANAANLELGGTYDLDNGGSVGFDDVILGTTAGGAGTINHSNDSTLTTTDDIFIGNDTGQTGAYNLSGTNSLLDVTDYIYLGHNGTGTFTHTGGVNSNNRIMMGNNSNGVGTYNFSGSSSSMVSDIIGVGLYGTGEFTQSGGDITLRAIAIAINGGGKGIYNLNDASATITTSGYITVSSSGSGIFNHSAGFITAVSGADITVGYSAGGEGTYNLNGSSASIDIDALQVGRNGDGTFNHIAGSNSVRALVIGAYTGSSGTYNIGGVDSSLTVSSYYYVGFDADGHFNINPNAVIQTPDFYVGERAGVGYLDMQNGSEITVTKNFVIGANANISGTGSNMVHMDGADLLNKSIDEVALAGLENLTFSFESNNVGGTADTVEVAGYDLGVGAENFNDNFMVGSLQLGNGSDDGYVQLVDSSDNQTDDGGSNEALYLSSLVVESGSVLDLNGLNIYIDGTYAMNGEVIDSVGTGSIYYNSSAVFGAEAIPEPFSIVLLSLGVGALIRRKK